MSKFQLALLVVFGLFIVVAVMVFAFYRGGGGNVEVDVVVWGDIPASDMHSLFNATAVHQEDRNLRISYVEKSSQSISAEFTEALARGGGPDLIILTQDKIWKERDKLTLIPYSSISERVFINTFVEEGELFLMPNGILALPLSIDPLVLYYNRNILSSAGQAQPIVFWDEVDRVAPALNKRDLAGNITTSTIALGEAINIPNFKDILSLLLLQAGTPITSYVERDNTLRSEFRNSFGLPINPTESSLNFYTQFSNPNRSYYSWNRSLPDAQTHFTSNDSAYYVGFVSEYRVLRNKNPILNIGVSLVPQSRASRTSLTYGNLRGIAISRGSKNPSAALAAAQKLISKDVSYELSQILFVPSPRKDILVDKPVEAIPSVFYDAAIQSRGWLDPDAGVTRVIFQEMIESVTSGRANTNEAISRADREMEALIR